MPGASTSSSVDRGQSLSRRLPLTDQVIEILDTCDRTSRTHFVSRRTFFVSATGNQVSTATVGKVFGRIWDQAGLPGPWPVNNHDPTISGITSPTPTSNDG